MARPKHDVEIIGASPITEMEVIKVVYSRVADLEFRVAKVEQQFYDKFRRPKHTGKPFNNKPLINCR